MSSAKSWTFSNPSLRIFSKEFFKPILIFDPWSTKIFDFYKILMNQVHLHMLKFLLSGLFRTIAFAHIRATVFILAFYNNNVHTSPGVDLVGFLEPNCWKHFHFSSWLDIYKRLYLKAIGRYLQGNYFSFNNTQTWKLYTNKLRQEGLAALGYENRY